MGKLVRRSGKYWYALAHHRLKFRFGSPASPLSRFVQLLLTQNIVWPSVPRWKEICFLLLTVGPAEQPGNSFYLLFFEIYTTVWLGRAADCSHSTTQPRSGPSHFDSDFWGSSLKSNCYCDALEQTQEFGVSDFTLSQLSSACSTKTVRLKRSANCMLGTFLACKLSRHNYLIHTEI